MVGEGFEVLGVDAGGGFGSHGRGSGWERTRNVSESRGQDADNLEDRRGGSVVMVKLV